MKKEPGEIKNCYYESPVGLLEIGEDNHGICRIGFTKTASRVLDRKEAAGNETEVGKTVSDKMFPVTETPLMMETIRQLQQYFSWKRKEFDLPLSFYGTDFQKDVWKALMEIPYGETRSYGQIAEVLGRPKACRAVGMANHVNEILIVVPCHRVIGANGSLTGYGGGLDVKEKLLKLEQKNR